MDTVLDLGQDSIHNLTLISSQSHWWHFRALGISMNSYPISFFKIYLFIYLAVPDLRCGMRDLGPWPGIEPGPPALRAQSLNCWTTREVPDPISVNLRKIMYLSVVHSYLGQWQQVIWGQHMVSIYSHIAGSSLSWGFLSLWTDLIRSGNWVKGQEYPLPSFYPEI